MVVVAVSGAKASNSIHEAETVPNTRGLNCAYVQCLARKNEQNLPHNAALGASRMELGPLSGRMATLQGVCANPLRGDVHTHVPQFGTTPRLLPQLILVPSI